MFSDHDIESQMRENRIVIEPYYKDFLNPASYDITLAREFLRFPERLRDTWPIRIGIDLPPMDRFATDELVMEPGDFVLGGSDEYIRLGDKVAAQVEGKSSLGRLGLFVHVTAGFIDPGFNGRLTLELYNAAPFPIILTPGMRIAQLAFFPLLSRTSNPYSGRYQGDKTVQASRYSFVVKQ